MPRRHLPVDLPMLQADDRGSIVATQSFVTDSGPPGVAFAALDELGDRLRDERVIAVAGHPVATPPSRTLERAALCYSSDGDPGYRRVGSGKEVAYLDPEGRPVEDEAVLARIRSLAIPPAWTDVWICADPDGHLQACGRDARGRKQYRYHPAFRREREVEKYERVLRFARRLPRIRAVVERDLSRPGLPRERVLALVVRLLELTHLRVGNEEYARLHRSYGLTTLRRRHALVEGMGVRFRFKGKSGRQHEVGLRDRRLAGLIRQTRELPGQHLFEYLDEDGEVRPVRSDDVNAYLRAAAGIDVSAKDFRTWAATVLAFRALRAAGRELTGTRRRRSARPAIERVAQRLGNTATVCRSSYVHPSVVEAWEEGDLDRLRQVVEPPDQAGPPTPEEEVAVLRLLERRRRAARHQADRAHGARPGPREAGDATPRRAA